MTRFYVNRYIVPCFDEAGGGLSVSCPRNLEIFGGNIRIGVHGHINAAKGSLTRLCTWTTDGREGKLSFGDYVLISPGTHIVASDSISVGSNTMFASGCYVSDSDWHDTYDRTRELDKHRPIVIGENVWLGVRVIVGKGVTIGDNSIIGAGSVVVLFEEPEINARKMDQLMRYLLKDNTLRRWLRSVIAPTKED